MNDITKKIRGYSRRQPITDKRFKFSNDLLARAAYIGNGKSADKIFGVQTEEDKKKEIKKEKESKEKLSELDQYQEDQKKSRDRNYRKLAKEDEYK